MRIMGIERDEHGCNHYRIIQPLYKLLEHGMAKVITIEEGPELGTEPTLQKILEADVIVVHRPASEDWFRFIKTCRKYGKVIIADYDDDPFNTSPLNPYYQYIGTSEVVYQWPDGTKEMLWSKNPAEHGGRFINIEQNIRRRDLFRSSFKNADMVSTTTDILQQKLSQINKNTVVLPNLIDFSIYPNDLINFLASEEVRKAKKRIRIGWQGGSSHYEDLWMVSKAIKNILRKYSNVDFVFWGDIRMYGLFKDVPIGRVECHSWVKHAVYPYKLATLNLDIGICPVIDNEFNRNKSAIKYFEYSVLKIPTVASNIPPYSPCIKDYQDGILVDENGWQEALERLIVDEKLRTTIGQNAWENIEKNYNADRKAHLWLDAYNSVLKKDITELMEVS